MTEEVIGRADYELRARIDQLKKDLVVAEGELKASGAKAEADYTSRAAKWGPIMAEGAKAAVKGLGAASTAMFALATKGGDDLIRVQNEFQSETGVSAAEAARAGKIINRVAGENQAALAAVGAAAQAIHNDLGAVGPVADDLLARFTKFGRVTKQEPVAAVKAFDDILDAWDLTAADSQKVMDVLVASHEKYGGVVADDEAALKALAPVLRAVNGTWQDGIKWLDLAKASGIDATVMFAGLNTALAKVKSPDELQRLVDDISATEDPLLRAQKAVDLFGQKAGPRLANALAGRTLKDFGIDMTEAAGSTDKAAEALDRGFGAQMRKKISELGADIRQLGADWGPAVTAAGGFASLLGAIGADEIVKRLGPKVVAALRAAGKAGGEALVDAAGTATGAAGTIFGNIIADPIAAALDPDRNSLLGRLVRKAGDKVATAYLKALYLGDAVSGAVAAAWNKVVTSSLVLAAAGAAGGTVGTVFAAAAGAAIAIGLPIALAVVHGKLTDAIESELNDSFAKAAQAAIASGDPQRMVELQGQLQAQWDKVMAGVDPLKGPFGGGQDPKAIQAAIDMLKQALGQSAPQLRDAWWQDMGFVGWATGPALVEGATKSLNANQRTFHNTVQIFTKAGLEAMKIESRLAGLRSMEAVAQGIIAARQKPVDAFDTLREMLKRPMSRLQEQTRLLAELTSRDLAKGLRSSDPAIKAQAQATKAYIIDRLEELKTGSGRLTKEQAALVAKGLKSKDPDIKAAAQRIKRYVETPLAQLRDNGFTYGQGFTRGFIRGLVADIDRVGANAAAISRVVKKYLQVRSPSELGAFSTMGGPEGWGARFSDLYAKGLGRGLPRVNQALAALHGFSPPPGVMTAALTTAGVGDRSARNAGAPSSAAGGGITINGGIHLSGVGSDVSPAAASRFGRQVLEEVARGFREGSARRGLTVAVRP